MNTYFLEMYMLMLLIVLPLLFSSLIALYDGKVFSFSTRLVFYLGCCGRCSISRIKKTNDLIN